ncbi:hypothetical protein MRX96_018335 [Rhipicephalus microplus]
MAVCRGARPYRTRQVLLHSAAPAGSQRRATKFARRVQAPLTCHVAKRDAVARMTALGLVTLSLPRALKRRKAKVGAVRYTVPGIVGPGSLHSAEILRVKNYAQLELHSNAY